MCWLGHGQSQDAKAKTIIGSWEQVKMDTYYKVNNFLGYWWSKITLESRTKWYLAVICKIEKGNFSLFVSLKKKNQTSTTI